MSAGKADKNLWRIYQDCRAVRDRNMPLWRDISKFTGIGVDIDSPYNSVPNNTAGQQMDDYVDDPTSAICTNQVGDSIIGIMWGTGDKVFDIIPSRYVEELVDPKTVSEYFAFATSQTLYHMNHPDAGYITALQPYAYDQVSFGTSGIGTFPNQAFKTRVEENALIFQSYGVDNIVIAEGKSGQVDIVFASFNWTANRIVGEFAMQGGAINGKMYQKIPAPIRKAFDAVDFSSTFKIVLGMMPRGDYDPKLKGARGARYKGTWFMDDEPSCKPFFEESYSERAINVCRQIKVRNEVWGRSSMTMLMSSIRGVNFAVGSVFDILEKMSNPSLGISSNAIFGDGVLDTSPNGLTVFNSMMSDGKNPVFPLYDVGDPTGIIQFMIPYLNEKITTAAKSDIFLDFNSAKEMTAAEALKRYAIRGKSLSGILSRQKNERLVPDVKRSIGILYEMGELGVDPTLDEALAKKFRSNRRTAARVIPDAVLQVMKSGRPWYELRFNNELEKLIRTEAVQNLIQILSAITAIAAVYPDIINAVDWYKLLKDINDNLDYNNQILCSAEEFKERIAGIAKQRQAAMMMEAAQAGSEVNKNAAVTNKNQAEAQNAARP